MRLKSEPRYKLSWQPPLRNNYKIHWMDTFLSDVEMADIYLN